MAYTERIALKERIEELEKDNVRLNALFDSVRIPNGKFLTSSRFQTASDLLTAYEVLETQLEKSRRAVGYKLDEAKCADETLGEFEAKIEHKDKRIEELEAKVKGLRRLFHASPDDNICLNCGRLTPCHLHREETAGDPDWPGSPCTFDIPVLAEMRERAEKAEAERDKVCKAILHACCIKLTPIERNVAIEKAYDLAKEALGHD